VAHARAVEEIEVIAVIVNAVIVIMTNRAEDADAVVEEVHQAVDAEAVVGPTTSKMKNHHVVVAEAAEVEEGEAVPVTTTTTHRHRVEEAVVSTMMMTSMMHHHHAAILVVAAAAEVRPHVTNGATMIVMNDPLHDTGRSA